MNGGGSIEKRLLKDGTPRYDCHFRVGGRQRKRTFRRKRAAQRFLTKTMATVHDGSYVETKPALMKEVFDEWLADLETREMLGEVKTSTAGTYRCNVNKHLATAFGDYRSDQLTAKVVASWRRELAERIASRTMSAKSYNNLHGLLHQIFAWARHPAQGYMAHDPLIGVKRLKREKCEAEFLEDDDIQALLKAVANDPEANAVIHSTLFGGLRRGEVFALGWKDMERFNVGGRLHVRSSIYKGVVTTPKTANSERAVDVPQRVLDALDRHGAGRNEGYIFQTRTGAPIDPNSWYSRKFTKIRDAAKLRSSIGLHSLRHTYASLLLRNGENPKYVSRQMGHSSVSFTMDVYGHLFKVTSTEAMQRLQTLVPPERPELRVVSE